MKFGMVLCGVVAALSAANVSAASLLTSSAGYTGPVLDLSGFNGFYTFTAGPVALPGGITYSSTTSSSVIGKGGYGLQQNGSSVNALIIGTNSGTDTVTLSFATPVASFGGGLNYSLRFSDNLPDGADPVIAAYDASNQLIASYDLFALAPISTPGATDAFAFRGIDGGGTAIASFTLSGGYLIIAGVDGGTVPEPATWALMVAGFGLVGMAVRRRAAAVAA